MNDPLALMKAVLREYDQPWTEGETGPYSYMVSDWGKSTLLTVVRKDSGEHIPWGHIQDIKNMALGEDREAFELYPAQSRVVDEGPFRHLMVMPEGITIPYGLGVKSGDRERFEEIMGNI